MPYHRAGSLTDMVIYFMVLAIIALTFIAISHLKEKARRDGVGRWRIVSPSLLAKLTGLASWTKTRVVKLRGWGDRKVSLFVRVVRDRPAYLKVGLRRQRSSRLGGRTLCTNKLKERYSQR